MAPNIGIDNSISDDARSESPLTIDDVHDHEVAKHTPQDDAVNQLLSTPSTARRYHFNFNQHKSQFELNSPSNHKQQPTSHEKQLQATLSSILILASPTNPRVESLLSSYNGQLIPIGTNILLGLRNAAPTSLAARVGDYNENLFYEMEKKDMDLESIIRASTTSTSTTNNNGLDVSTLQQELTSFETTLRQTLQHENISYRGSFMQTESTMYQPAHVDYDYSILSKYGSKLFLAFFPLTEEGAYLQLWQDDENVSIDDPREGTVVFIPYGNMLIVPSDTIHGGGFKRGEGGNLRFHLYIEILEDEEVVVEDRGVEEKKEDTNNIALLDHPMNKYTEKYDRRRELCERFVDANGLDKLLGVFFDTDELSEDSPVGKVQEGIEAINSLAKLVKKKGQNLLSTKSANKLDLHGTGNNATRKSPSSVNLYGLTEEVV